MAKILMLHPDDHLVVALQDLGAGQRVRLSVGEEIVLQEAIPAKHKFSRVGLGDGAQVRMYNTVVGQVHGGLGAGCRVTTENLQHATLDYQIEGKPIPVWTPPAISHLQQRHWMGYSRSNGRAGTANYWLIVPLVFCENHNVETLQRALSDQLGFSAGKSSDLDLSAIIQAHRSGANPEALRDIPIRYRLTEQEGSPLFPNVDGIKYLLHEGGCGNSKSDVAALLRLLAGYITHPNVAGATVIGLGCQFAQEVMLREAIHRLAPKHDRPLYVLEQQSLGTEADLLAEAARATFIGLTRANQTQRTPQSLDKLCLGLECGGSDGFSGISANPTLGRVSDLLVALGGRAILAEFPELNGVEQELVNRCQTSESAQKFVDLMRAYAASAQRAGSTFADNPSPGNIREGLITDAMKSAGAARKGGTSPIIDVLDYGEVATQPGLHLLNTPGNDVESTTALAGAGANLIVFTTGLGTPTGNPVAPVVKISSNSALAERMPDIIDFDCGEIIRGKISIDALAERLLEYLIEVASGRALPAAVRRGQNDFIPWRRGVSL
jgi:altronate hydrolase